MEETHDSQQSQQENTPRLRGLYRNVKISVKALDTFIVVGVLAILILVIIGLQDAGFTVTFDSRGGSDVPAQTLMYGQTLQEPEPPTREGYTFTGWFRDTACNMLWNMESDTIETDITLYAGWKKME